MLDEQDIDITTMTAPTGVRAMLDFMDQYRPQHGDADELWCSWGPRDEMFEFAVSRRMQRHGHPDTTVGIAIDYRLTPARRSLVGETRIDVPRDAKATPGYHAVSGASPLESRVDQSSEQL